MSGTNPILIDRVVGSGPFLTSDHRAECATSKNSALLISLGSGVRRHIASSVLALEPVLPMPAEVSRVRPSCGFAWNNEPSIPSDEAIESVRYPARRHEDAVVV